MIIPINKSFKSYDDALDTFKEMAEKINTQYEKMDEIQKIYTDFSSLLGSNLTESENVINNWFERCENLPSPWPNDKIKEFVEIEVGGVKGGLILDWCEPRENSQEINYLKKTLKMGMQPDCTINNFIPIALSATSLSFEAFNAMLKYIPCLLSEIKLPLDNTQGVENDGTILHLIADSYFKTVTVNITSKKTKREKKFKKILSLIEAYDPECFFIKTKDGMLAEDFATKNGKILIQEIRKRLEYEKELKKHLKTRNKNTRKKVI